MITTIIPTYRRPKLLRRAIRSVLSQTYSSFQVCVYDNASGDETACVAAEMQQRDPRVRYFCHAQNIGALRNIVYAMERVQTTFFSILSDDDVLLPEFYETALAGFEKCPEAICSVSATIQMSDQGWVYQVPLAAWRPGLYKPPAGMQAMLKKLHPEWMSVLFRREVLQEVGGLDEEVGGAADLDFELRTAARFPIVVSTRPGAIYVIRPSSASKLLSYDFTWAGWEKMIRNLAEDERIPQDARAYATTVLRERIKSALFLTNGLRSVVLKNWRQAYEAAEILRNRYHENGKAFLVRSIARVCESFSGAYHAFRLLIAALSCFRRLRSVPWQRKFGDYGRMLES